MNKNYRKTIKTLFIIVFAIECLTGIYIIDKAKETIVENNKKVIKTNKMTIDKNYIIYLGNQKIPFSDLNGSMVFYNNVTMKLEGDKLKTIASFGISSVKEKEKKQILNIIKHIEDAKMSNQPVLDNLDKNKNNLIIVSGTNFYIDIFKENECYIYKITNNEKTVSKYLKYCKGVKNEKRQ